jgi:hypothetical protein
MSATGSQSWEASQKSNRPSLLRDNLLGTINEGSFSLRKLQMTVNGVEGVVKTTYNISSSWTTTSSESTASCPRSMSVVAAGVAADAVDGFFHEVIDLFR